MDTKKLLPAGWWSGVNCCGGDGSYRDQREEVDTMGRVTEELICTFNRTF
jgi:hypothetical protein